MDSALPEQHQRAAEQVRAHLVHLRGGAPFVSPADAAQLVAWLDDGVPVARILRGLEKAAEARRAGRRRSPLEVRHAARYLGRPRGAAGLGPVAADVPLVFGEGPLAPLLARLAQPHPPDAPPEEDRLRLAAALAALDPSDPDALATGAISTIAAWFDELWTSGRGVDRALWRARALDALGDVADLLAEHELDELLEEHARGLFRDTCPWLSSTTVLQLMG